MEVEETNNVAEWLGNLIKGREDSTIASYPKPPNLTRVTIME
jgi:hypothetical protein